MESQTKVTPWAQFNHYGLTHARIWTKKTPFGLWQRHEWRREDGSTSAEPWTPTGAKDHPAHALPATPKPTDSETMIHTLERIAAGHNDPRSLALETLAQIGHT